MTLQTTRWFQYGEPLGDCVEAKVITAYHTGPHETREDEVRHGTVAIEALELLDTDEEIKQHTHDDRLVNLSALSPEGEGRLMQYFSPDNDITRLIRQGCTPPEAIDYHMVEQKNWSQNGWKAVRGVTQSTISQNIAKAKEKVE